ncbi:MAG: hypothetical protein RLZZ401_2408 [Pseudomonadota bacterium]|jgi:hypothetical protein
MVQKKSVYNICKQVAAELKRAIPFMFAALNTAHSARSGEQVG